MRRDHEEDQWRRRVSGQFLTLRHEGQGSKPSTLFRLPCETGRKVGTTSSQYGPYGLGCTRTTMPSTERSETARWRKSSKTGPSSDWSLQLDSMKPESLVMPYQLRRREYVPGPCTHRPSHHGSHL